MVAKRNLRKLRGQGGVGGDCVMGEVFFICHDFRSWFVELHSPQKENGLYFFNLLFI